MDLIVAVYDDWGIGCEGDQPIALSADRKFFRRTTANSTVIVGRKTVGSFPGHAPRPQRRTILLSRQDVTIPGFETAHSPEEAVELSKNDERVFVIGGGTVYRQMLPMCDRAIITKVHTTAPCDTWFPNLDELEDWELTETLESGEENGIAYEMCVYVRK
ncbi:MAG: dihydrofolate reductase [Oscillospiraceae bacterium]|nr:dihydrofolate reductase [Oscillospiraceae bacterium]